MSNSDPTQAFGLLYLHAQTALHPGSGHALGTVDLPIQRERHTQWPVIPGSSLKGVLRDACRRKSGKPLKEADSDATLVGVFGPPSGNSDLHSGALSITDARILAFPVRSIKGVFAWVTCPAALERFSRDLRLAHKGELKGLSDLGKDLDIADKNLALTADGSPLLVDGKSLILEEFEFTRVGKALSPDFVKAVGDAIDHEDTRRFLAGRLVVLHDDHFTHFVRHATEVTARIGLDYESKTVKQGALFYQEFLPAETLFYAVAIAGNSRSGNGKTAADVLGYVREKLPPILQVGGDAERGEIKRQISKM